VARRWLRRRRLLFDMDMVPLRLREQHGESAEADT
jgi:hypothetical protein